MSAHCKCKEVECEECPEWIFTLADLIMCMMGLFVILWVLKPSPKENPPGSLSEEEIKVISAIKEAFGYVPNANSNDPIDLHMLMKKLDHVQGPGDGGKTTGGMWRRDRLTPMGISCSAARV